MTARPRRPRRVLTALVAVVASAGPAACTPATEPAGGGWPASAVAPEPVVAASDSVSPAGPLTATVPAPAAFRGRPVPPRLMVVSTRPLPVAVLERARGVPGVRAATRLSLASLSVAGRTVTLAAADLAAYRRFVPAQAARTRGVWDRAAAGELVLEPAVAAALRQPLGGTMPLGGGLDSGPGSGLGSVSLRVGAFSPMPPSVDGLVNERRGAHLGMTADNALLVSTTPTRLERVSRAVARFLPDDAVVYPLATDGATAGPTGGPTGGTTAGTGAEGAEAPGAAAVGTPAVGAALLTGGSVARAAGSFRYRYFPDGTVQPDPAWVAANIRTEAVPVLGAVTCHRVMLPRLRWALQEVVARGLAAAVDPDDFGGCYVPRFIGHDPANGLSLHTWGIALDLNVSGNQRGTAGEIDRSVVAVLKKWGFAWGGDWSYTDPMHFELAALTRPSL